MTGAAKSSTANPPRSPAGTKAQITLYGGSGSYRYTFSIWFFPIICMTVHKRERDSYSSQTGVDDDNGKKRSGKVVAFMALNFRKGSFVEIKTLSIEEFREYAWPKVQVKRFRSWEGYRGKGWTEVMRNYSVIRLRHLADPKLSYEERKSLILGVRDQPSVVLTLLVGIQAGGLAFPFECHWIARALFLSGALLTTAGIMASTVIPGTYHLFFGEDAEEDKPAQQRLTLETNAMLCHEIDLFFSMPGNVVVGSIALFILAVITYVATATIDGDGPSPSLPRGPFVFVSLFPAVAFIILWQIVFMRLSASHRRFRNKMEKSQEVSAGHSTMTVNAVEGKSLLV